MTITSKLKNPPEATPKLREEMPTFKECYLAAFTGLHAGFQIGRSYIYPEGDESHTRSEDLAKIAWNSAKEARKLFVEDKTIENFNRKISHVK